MGFLKSAASRVRVPVGLLGSACLSVWIFLAIDAHVTMQALEENAGVVSIVMGAFVASRLVADLVVCRVADRVGKLSEHPAIVFGAPICLIVGTAFVTCAANGWIEGLPLLVAGGVFCGVGAEMMLILWLELFSTVSFAMVKRLVLWMIGIQAVSSVLYAAPLGLRFAVCLALPVLSVLGFYFGSKRLDKSAKSRQTHWHKVSFSKALPIGAGVALLYFGFHFLQAGFQGSLSGEMGGYDVAAQASVAGRWLAFFVVLVVIKRMRDFHYESMFRTAGIIGITAFLILPLPFEQAFLVFCTMTIVACFLTEYAVSLAVVSIAGYANIAAAKLIAWGRAAINVGGVAGLCVGWALSGLWLSSHRSEYVAVASAVAVLLLAIASIWLLRERSISNFLWGKEASEDAVLAAGEVDGVSARCAYIAAQFALTARETEVFDLLLMGRSAPYIAETLYVSTDTAKAHIRHIYQKLNVHNRQDLLTLAQDLVPGSDAERAN